MSFIDYGPGTRTAFNLDAEHFGSLTRNVNERALKPGPLHPFSFAGNCASACDSPPAEPPEPAGLSGPPSEWRLRLRLAKTSAGS